MANDCTEGPWAWEHRATESGKHIATLLVTKHRPVPCNDPVIFALREDWMGSLSPEREAAKQMILAAPDLLNALQFAVARLELANKAGDPIFSALLPMAKAAIAKAKGQGGA